MTRDETITILNRLSRLYMTHAKRISDNERQTMVDVWEDTFRDTPFDDVSRAVSVYANRGKPFMPNPPDIINEIINLEQYGESKLFNRLRKEAQRAYEGEEHIVINDLGGIVKDSTAPCGFRHVVPETHVTHEYTQADFANLPVVIQLYAEDIDGLKKLHEEIQSNAVFARRRFIEAVPYLTAQNEM